MMITRRESLHRLFRLAALAPLGLAAACMTEQDLSVGEAERGLAEAPDGDAEADALAEAADRVIELDPETARQHMAAMDRCLREHGVEPPAGKFRVLIDGPPPGAAARGERVLFRVRRDVKPADGAAAKDEVIELDTRTREAMRACAAQVGFPGKPAR